MIRITMEQTHGTLDMSMIRIYLPPAAYNIASGRPLTAAGSDSALSYFQKTWELRKDQVVRAYGLEVQNSNLRAGEVPALLRDRAIIQYVKDGQVVAHTYGEWS